MYANFNYYPLILKFLNRYRNVGKISKFQKGALQFISDNREDSYEMLLNKTGKSQMTVYRLRSLCIEIVKTLHGLNPFFMKNILIFNTENRPVRSKNINNLKVHVSKTQTYGTKSIITLGPNIWNSLSKQLKCCEKKILRNGIELNVFVRIIKIKFLFLFFLF